MPNSTEEKYERNYIVIRPLSLERFRVTGFFANHKTAWEDDNTHENRKSAEKHAKFLMNEFSMGSETNPIPIFHVNRVRNVLMKKGSKFIDTDKKVTDLL